MQTKTIKSNSLKTTEKNPIKAQHHKNKKIPKIALHFLHWFLYKGNRTSDYPNIHRQANPITT